MTRYPVSNYPNKSNCRWMGPAWTGKFFQIWEKNERKLVWIIYSTLVVAICTQFMEHWNLQQRQQCGILKPLWKDRLRYSRILLLAVKTSSQSLVPQYFIYSFAQPGLSIFIYTLVSSYIHKLGFQNLLHTRWTLTLKLLVYNYAGDSFCFDWSLNSFVVNLASSSWKWGYLNFL